VLLTLRMDLLLELIRHRIEYFVASIFLYLFSVLLLLDSFFIQTPPKILHPNFQFLKQPGSLCTLDLRFLLFMIVVLDVLKHVAVIFFCYFEPNFSNNFKSHQVGFTFLVDCVPCIRKVVDEQRIEACVLVVEKKQLPSQISKSDHLRQISQKMSLA